MAMTSAMAFRNASRERMSEGRMPRRIRFSTARPASRQSRVFAAETAFCAPLFVRLMPSASMAEAMVLAVYIPPHEPAPGMAQASIWRRSWSVISPRACRPTASNTLTTSTFWPRWQPGLIVPPYTNTAGRSSRAIAIRQPGMFLSQPPMATRPSNASQPATASIESAMISRDTRE